MGFYDERILPRMLNLVMNTRAIREQRQRCLEHVSGDVLEIGFESGLNLPFYPTAVSKVVGVDPSHTAGKLARKRIAASPFAVEFVGLSAEKIPVADAAVERWQLRLNGLQQKLFGGCHLDRRISQMISDAGFDIERVENSYLKGAPKFGGYLYRGVARRAQ